MMSSSVGSIEGVRWIRDGGEKVRSHDQLSGGVDVDLLDDSGAELIVEADDRGPSSNPSGPGIGAGASDSRGRAPACPAPKLPTVSEPDLSELATRLFAMARDGDAATLAAYVDAGVPVNLANEKGDTLLMLAAYHGHAVTVTVLLERGADPDRLNDRGQAPVAGAVFKGEDEVVRTLVAGGADPRAGHPTAVDTATMFGREDLRTLLE